MFLCSSSFLVRVAQELEEKEKKSNLAGGHIAQLIPHSAETWKGGLWICPPLSFPSLFQKKKTKKKKAISVLRGMICSFLSLEKPAIKMEKYISVT